ncbi:MAG: VPLPA-CTERM sorting domain-containing protein [Pseudomonadota bacterium]
MLKTSGVIAGFAALLLSSGAAHASVSTFVFKGEGNNVTPEGTMGQDFFECATSTPLQDYCSNAYGQPAQGLDFVANGVNLTVNAYEGVDADTPFTANGDVNGVLTRLIQDRSPRDSGLGAWSEDTVRDDQTQFDAREAIEFVFDQDWTVTNVEFNAGGDLNCTDISMGGGEGHCGEFELTIFNSLGDLVSVSTIDVTNDDVVEFLGIGARFVLRSITPDAGFAVATMTVSNVPVPAALPLLISGVAGLGFASRRRKAA